MCRGVQVVSRDYDLMQERAFKQEDILELFPIVKANIPKSRDAADLMEAGKAYLAQGQLALAYRVRTRPTRPLCTVPPSHSRTACLPSVVLERVAGPAQP